MTQETSGSTHRCRLVIWVGCVLMLSSSCKVCAQQYEFTTLAGLGTEGYVDGKGRKAKFNQPLGIAVDPSGILFVADGNNHVIRKVQPDGSVSTFAGKPKDPGFADGPGNQAKFNYPEALAFDSSGILYVADYGNHVIRKIAPDGVVSTMVGMPGKKGYADGQGASVRFNAPTGIALDSSNNVYVADMYNHVIRRVSSDGTVTTIAGRPGNSGLVCGDRETSRLKRPERLAVSSSNTVYICEPDYPGLRTVTSDGSISSFVGGLEKGQFSDGQGKEAGFGFVSDAAIDKAGNLFVTDRVQGAIRKITTDGMVTTIAGKWISMHDREVIFGRASRDGVGLDARFSYPQGIAVDKDGNIYVADTEDNTIRVGRPIRK